MSSIVFSNNTALDDAPLAALMADGACGWNIGAVQVRVRYSRGADFSGSCYYASRRIFINIGRHLQFPYRLRTHLARALVVGRMWYKPGYVLVLRDGYQLVAFLFMHELFHLLVMCAGRNTRQKESMCDRFAARFVLERYGVEVHGPAGEFIPRNTWDFQDVDGFVGAARVNRAFSARKPF